MTEPRTSEPSTSEPAVVEPSAVAMPARLTSQESPAVAGTAVTEFGYDVFAGSAASVAAGDNMVVSPLSIAVALGMLEPGATGEAQSQLRDLLRIDDATAWHASMSALEQELEAREPEAFGGGEDEEPGELQANIANAAFLQPGYPFLDAYLDAIGTNYGAVLEELDFAVDQAAAADRINEFIADATADRITDLVSESDIDPATVLALVNALYLQASWQSEFDEAATVDDDFTLLDGSAVTVPLMHGRSNRSGQGDGWVAATKHLVGNIDVEVVLPDDGRFDDVASRYGDVVAEYSTSSLGGAELVVPKFETRVRTELTDILVGLGLTAPFQEGNLMGIADDPQLVLDKALHETWLSIDETGIEAAAATVLLVMATSAPIGEPVPVVLDRPFLFRIVDNVSGATMFIGRVMNPTA